MKKIDISEIKKIRNQGLFKDHELLSKLDYHINFYELLSDNIMGISTIGVSVSSIINFNTYIYSSIQGTLESMHSILTHGKIGDSYALLRKYYDAIILNIYTIDYIIEERSKNIENWAFEVKKINEWIKGEKHPLPNFGDMMKKIASSTHLKPLYTLFSKDKYSKIRERCNDNLHYNFFKNIILNDKNINRVYSKESLKWVNLFFADIEDLFVFHLCCVFFLQDNWMQSSYYIDCLDVGMTPEENSEYWVAPFIQKFFDSFITNKYPEVKKLIQENTPMYLE